MNAIITRLNEEKHKRILLKILLDFSRDSILSRNLIFKWWTALLLFYGLDRFSTDLDFDLVNKNLDENDILKRIWKILWKYWEIKDLRIKKYTIFWLLSYGKIDYNIKIEINRRWLTGWYSTKNLLWIYFNVMNLEDMCANKLLALLWRNKLANRDIYDIFFILDNWFTINQKIIEEKTGESFKNYLKKCINFLEQLWEKYNILDWLWLVINDKKKKFIKEDLLKNTIFLLATYL